MQIPIKLQQIVIDHFDGNVCKANLWWGIPNPILSGVKPKDYQQNGSYTRLEKMIKDALKVEKK